MYIIKTNKGYVSAIIIDYKHNTKRVRFTKNIAHVCLFPELEVASVLLNSMPELKNIGGKIDVQRICCK